MVLAALLGATWYTGTLVFRDYDPYRALFSLGSAEIVTSGLIILGITVVGSLFIERFWCRYLCPLGAVTGLLARLGLTRIRREPASCTNCDLCTKACYAGIPAASVDAVNDTACTGCIVCVEACPHPGALKVEVPLLGRLFGSRSRRESLSVGDGAARRTVLRLKRWPRLAYGLVVPVVLLATIGVASALGDWQTVGTTEVTVDQTTGVPSTDNIKGWRTPKDVSDLFGIPLEELYQGMGWPADFPADSPLKDLEGKVPNFSVTQVRDWVTAELARKGITVPSGTSGETPQGAGEGSGEK